MLEFDSSYWSDVQSPVIGADGAIFVGVGSTLYALTRGGTNKWSASLGFFGKDSPAIGAGGVVYTSALGLYAFDSGGINLWVAGGDSYASPVVGTDDKLYVADAGRSLLAVTALGQPTWHVLSGPQYGPYTTPAIDAGGRIYYCISNTVWALSPQGQVQWRMSSITNGLIVSFDLANTSPIIGPDGTLYASLGSTLYAIATGTNGPADSPWPMYRQNARHTGKVEKPSLQNPQRRCDANSQFQLYAQLGQTNLVESTTNLSVWSSLTSIVVTTVPLDFVDLTASNAPSRFYRTLSQ